MITLNKHQLIKHLQLAPHPLEGGYFCRHYSSQLSIAVPYDEKLRQTLSSIYYMLTDDSPIGYLHRNRSDIVHCFHGGSAIHYWLVSPEGELEKVVLGSNLAAGEQLQMVVKGGYWKASRLMEGEFALISEAVSPGFEYEDNQLATIDDVSTYFPRIEDLLLPLLAPSAV